MSSRRFVTLDVFTNRRLAGNPLAVVLDAEGLDTSAMQAIAREFNLSETVFVLPPQDPIHLARLRIFTPHRELPFAGHPTVGAAVQLALQNGATPGQDLNFMVEEEVGIVPCTVRLANGETGRARFDLPKLPERVDAALSYEAIAQALSLEVADLGFPDHEPRIYSAGNPFVFVPVRDRSCVARIKPRPDLWHDVFASGGGDKSVYAYTRDCVTDDAAFHARMFDAELGEDPATGSAVAAFAGVIMEFEPPSERSKTYAVEQGYEMGRPSRIILGLDVFESRLESASIGGEAVLVSEGVLLS